MPERVTLWLSVSVRASSFGGAGGMLLTRKVDMSFLPDLDGMSTMELYSRPEYGDGEGPMWGFKRRWWQVDGSCHLELQEMHIDPQGALLTHFERRTVTGRVLSRMWSTDIDGDPVPLLLASGWEKFGG